MLKGLSISFFPYESERREGAEFHFHDIDRRRQTHIHQNAFNDLLVEREHGVEGDKNTPMCRRESALSTV